MFFLKKQEAARQPGDKQESARERLLLCLSPLWKQQLCVVRGGGPGFCAALGAWLHSQQFVNQCHCPASEPWAGASAWLQPVLELSKLTHRASPPTQPTLWFIDMGFILCLGFEFISVEVLLCRKLLVPVPTISLCHFYLYALYLALTKP